jgi:hypothetical protein
MASVVVFLETSAAGMLPRVISGVLTLLWALMAMV